MTYTAKFHVDVEVPDSLADATMGEIREFTDHLADSGARQFFEDRDIDPANIQGVGHTFRWDFYNETRVWIRYVYEVRVPKRVWESLNGDWGG